MARTIPAIANVSYPDTRKMVPRSPIRAGSSSDDGHLYSLGLTSNLAYATAGAGVGVAMAWGDGQFVVNDGAFTERGRFRICKVSDAHVALSCSMYAFSPLTGGQVRFTCVGNGNSVTIVLGAALAITAKSKIDVTAGFVADAADGDYAEVTIETSGSCSIRDLWCQWDDVSPAGNYPGADDAFAAGAVGDFVPFDDTELVADSPVSADWLHQRRESIADVRTRRRMLYSWLGVIGTSGASLYAWPAPIRQHGVFPVVAGTEAEPKTLTLWARGQRIGAGDEVGVGVYDALTHRRLGGTSWPAGVGATWQKATIQLTETRHVEAPADYPGFMLCYVKFDDQHPADAERGEPLAATYDANHQIHSLSIWGQ